MLHGNCPTYNRVLNNGKEEPSQKQIGLLGGTFDPIHMAHLHMAEVARESEQLDEVWFIPSNIPPHKQAAHLRATDRLQMVQLATANIPYFAVCPIELQRAGPSYTLTTITDLKARYPHIQFSFIIGADMVEDLPNWYQIDQIVQHITFIGVGRPGWALRHQHPYYEYVSTVDMIPSHLSSTTIRKRKQDGKSIRFLVPDSVYEYIEENQLYG